MVKVTAPDIGTRAEEKRPKTGGRVKKDVGQLMAETRIRAELAVMHDDTTLPAELAAIYLCISGKQLGELRKRIPLLKGKESKFKGPRMIKLSDGEAIGSNQPVTYKIGDLRKYQTEHSGYDTFQTSLASGLMAWISSPAPFFVRLDNTSGRDSVVFVAKAWGWGSDVAAKELLIKGALDGVLKIKWVSPAEAARDLWEKPSEHKAFAKLWFGALKLERQIVKKKVEDTKIVNAVSEATLAVEEVIALALNIAHGPLVRAGVKLTQGSI
ncbi:hypothetical protein [Polaromonas sp. CG_9.11]|uniref:hypothetical protein n=1 Tax=Polaromonas sp. CG_9.11 TaxID=2787730 RepID=UPI0018C9A1CB|nr:hypothetical protein [Polaromonas sp. CG_9.11]MBG6075372.1 hypothetical protein [Polaromonas sp. CG_9.11]